MFKTEMYDTTTGRPKKTVPVSENYQETEVVERDGMLYFLAKDKPNITEDVYRAIKMAFAMNRNFMERRCMLK